mmetsp:Transcript_30664/g.91048  ORF Transcript_30664/g.91048 Transcript_30664/m.91048 type:complete len:204 (-) Transcript_30664:43-654(-)
MASRARFRCSGRHRQRLRSRAGVRAAPAGGAESKEQVLVGVGPLDALAAHVRPPRCLLCRLARLDLADWAEVAAVAALAVPAALRLPEPGAWLALAQAVEHRASRGDARRCPALASGRPVRRDPGLHPQLVAEAGAVCGGGVRGLRGGLCSPAAASVQIVRLHPKVRRARAEGGPGRVNPQQFCRKGEVSGEALPKRHDQGGE